MGIEESACSLPTTVSLFAGAGGLDIGLEMAGFETIAAVDFDPDSVASLRANQQAGIKILQTSRAFLEKAHILESDIAGIHRKDLVPACSDSWQPDLLAGGPPCQPFSSSGKQLALDDPRGRLFEHFVRLADELQPQLLLFENVRGLVTAQGPTGEPGEALAMVQAAFEKIGYGTVFSLLNAADYGAPQRRVRLFMLAARKDPLPQFLKPTHSETPTPGVSKPWVTLGQFLASREMPPAGDIVLPSPRLSKLLSNVPQGSGLKSAGAREMTRPGGHWGYKQGMFIADMAKPARTVTAAATQDWIRQDGILRRLTWQECAGLQGFPREWLFIGGKASRFRQIGNAVPSVFGAVLGTALIRALSTQRGQPPVTSAPWPGSFLTSIDHTKRERKRNGESRRMVRAALADGGADVCHIKGLGTAETSASGKRTP